MSGSGGSQQAEPIVLPDEVVVDAHHHLIDRSGYSYSLQDFLRDASSGHKVVASVYAEMMTGARRVGPVEERFLGEVEFAARSGDRGLVDTRGGVNVAAAIIGGPNLGLGGRVGPLLDQAIEIAPQRFRGVRVTTVAIPTSSTVSQSRSASSEILEDRVFREGVRELLSRNLVLDIGASADQVSSVVSLARVCPEVTMVVNHAMPQSQLTTREDFLSWKSGMEELAKCPNVRCKIGGLGMRGWGFHESVKVARGESRLLSEIWRPYIETAIEVFGVRRCMFESNYPTDAGAANYVVIWNALKRLIVQGSAFERSRLLRLTAADTYRLDIEGLLN